MATIRTGNFRRRRGMRLEIARQVRARLVTRKARQAVGAALTGTVVLIHGARPSDGLSRAIRTARTRLA
jgi:hypothetical protein